MKPLTAPTAAEPASPTLTPRERDCLRGLARGLRLQALALELGLSVKTVDNHIASAKKRLGAATREHAIALAIAQELL